MRTAADFIMEGHMRPQVVHRWSKTGVPNLFMISYHLGIPYVNACHFFQNN